MFQCDAEIVYLEEFQREQEVQLSAVRSEASRLETLLAERNQEVRRGSSLTPRLLSRTQEPRPYIFPMLSR